MGGPAALPSACDVSETQDLGMAGRGLHPRPRPIHESHTRTSEASGSGSGPALCQGGYSGSQRCPPCPEPPAAQGISRPSGLQGGRRWASLATPFISLRLPSWEGARFVVGRLFSPPSSRPLWLQGPQHPLYSPETTWPSPGPLGSSQAQSPPERQCGQVSAVPSARAAGPCPHMGMGP